MTEYIRELKGLNNSVTPNIIDAENASNISNLLIDDPLSAITNKGIGFTKQNTVSLVEKVVSILQLGKAEDSFVIAGDAEQYWKRFTPVADAGALGNMLAFFVYDSKIYMYVGQFNYTTYNYDKYEIQVKDFNNTLLDRFGARGAGNVQFDGDSSRLWIEGDKIYIADTNNNRVQKLDLDGTYDTQWAVIDISDIKIYDDLVYESTYDAPFYVHNKTGVLQRTFNTTLNRFFTVYADTIHTGSIGDTISKYDLLGNLTGTITSSEGNSRGLTAFNNILYTSNTYSISKFNLATDEEIITYGVEAAFWENSINKFYNNGALQVYTTNGISRLWVGDVSVGVIKTIL